MKRIYLFYFVLFVLFLQSCSDDSIHVDDTPVLNKTQLVSERSSHIIEDWHELYLEIERYLPDFRPNPTARAINYISIAAYETALPGMPSLTSLENILPSYTPADPNLYDQQYWSQVIENGAFWELALNQVYFETFNHFLIGMDEVHKEKVRTLYAHYTHKYRSDLSEEGYDRAVERGTKVANHVIQYALSDTEGASQIHDIEPADYVPPSGKGLWKPTAPDYKNACHPYWESVRKMVRANDNVTLNPPIPYSEDPSSEYYAQAKEVNDVVTNLTPEERWIAEFWSDDIVGITFSPPARQLAIANQLINLHDTDLETGLYFYLKLGLALNDASVIAWGGKYIYNTERPIDYITQFINPDFQPILGDVEGVTGQNPNFPGYPSGHSTFSTAAANVFSYFYKDVPFTDKCHKGRSGFNGTPRTFFSWDEMAKENAYSRIPLGVHVRMDCDEGVRLGNAIGQNVNAIDFTR